VIDEDRNKYRGGARKTRGSGSAKAVVRYSRRLLYDLYILGWNVANKMTSKQLLEALQEVLGQRLHVSAFIMESPTSQLSVVASCTARPEIYSQASKQQRIRPHQLPTLSIRSSDGGRSSKAATRRHAKMT
jgi:hypothetical protein